VETQTRFVTIQIPAKATGSHFYKYSNPEHLDWLRDILLKHELYLPTPNELNDEDEGKPQLAPMSEEEMVSFRINEFVKRNRGLTQDAYEKQAVTIRSEVRLLGPDALWRMLHENLYQGLERFRIYSLSKRFDNLHLWDRYAAHHSGYCLEFANEGPLFANAKEVSYGGRIEVGIEDPGFRNGNFFFYKAPKWRIEEEVRLVQTPNGLSKVGFDPQWLTRLILGTEMLDANRKSIHEWAKQRKPELTVVNDESMNGARRQCES
jgi:hypothetical protein